MELLTLLSVLAKIEPISFHKTLFNLENDQKWSKKVKNGQFDTTVILPLYYRYYRYIVVILS